MKIVFAAFDSPSGFLQRLSLEAGGGAAGRLRVATKTRLEARAGCILEVGVPGLPSRVLLRAAYVREVDGEAEFEIAAGEEHKRDFLVAVASGKAAASAGSRKHRRFPMRLPARFVVDGEDVPLRGDAETDEVNAQGVFLKTSRTLPDGAKVTIVLDPCDGSPEMEFIGKIVYTRKEEKKDGKDEEDAGVGVQFEALSNDDRKRLRRMIRDVKISGRMMGGEAED